jgi:hypothetical protein
MKVPYCTKINIFTHTCTKIVCKFRTKLIHQIAPREYAEGVNVNVPTSIGFLHHYRVCEFGGDDCVHTDSRVDRSVYRYRDLLVKNVEKVRGDEARGPML